MRFWDFVNEIELLGETLVKSNIQWEQARLTIAPYQVECVLKVQKTHKL